MRKALQSASKAAKKAGDSFLGVDTLLRALLEAKDVAAALTEAGVRFRLHPAPSRALPEHAGIRKAPALAGRLHCLPPIKSLLGEKLLACRSLPACMLMVSLAWGGRPEQAPARRS